MANPNIQAHHSLHAWVMNPSYGYTYVRFAYDIQPLPCSVVSVI